MWTRAVCFEALLEAAAPQCIAKRPTGVIRVKLVAQLFPCCLIVLDLFYCSTNFLRAVQKAHYICVFPKEISTYYVSCLFSSGQSIFGCLSIYILMRIRRHGLYFIYIFGR